MQHDITKMVNKQTLIVDADNGPNKSIQEAIDAAQPDAVIKIAPGLYSQNIVIRKPGLKLEPRDKNGDIIIVVSKDPTILIDLKKDEKCHLSGIKMSHSGNSEDVEELEKYDEQKNLKENLFGSGQDEGAQGGSSPEEDFVTKIPIDVGMNCVIMLNGGKLYMDECLIALNFIVKSYKGMLPAIVINQNADAYISRCEIKGTSAKNQEAKTIGILSQLGNMVIKDSKIHNQTYGGILVQGTSQNTVKIITTKIVQNKRVGIHFVGADAVPIVEQNRIENNEGPGIKVGIGNMAKIFGNEIKTNNIGIEVISADPLILNNRIDKNYTDGIITKVYEGLRCDGRIKSNQTISGNKENGIHCTGARNFTRIESNTFIGYNKKAGIKADNEARIVIINKNVISKNLGQGILLVETSSATIEDNTISDNIKANIALGGQNSVDTFIVKNRILGGRCEGIFMIECGECWIIRNTISENNDGIVCITAIPDIRKNTITKNKSNGIMILKDSRPKIIQNEIHENDGIGLFVRDKSAGIIKENQINSNEIELVVERRHQALESIVQENKVKGDIRIPQNYDCNIF